MRVHGVAFLAVELRCEPARQRAIQQLLDREDHVGAGLLAFAPIKDELFALQAGQEFPRGGNPPKLLRFGRKWLQSEPADFWESCLADQPRILAILSSKEPVVSARGIEPRTG